MAIFGKNKEKTEKEKVVKKADENVSVGQKKATSEAKTEEEKTTFWNEHRGRGNAQGILEKPRITEKTAILAGQGVYTFVVDPQYGKNEVEKAFKKVYGKTPVKVNMINATTKKKRTRFGIGTTKRKKKALVYLKKGQTIDFV